MFCMEEEEQREADSEDGQEAPPAPHAWIKYLATVTFHLEEGQQLESVWPPNLELSEEERSNLAFLSFPDSHSNSKGDCCFSFRFPAQSRGTASLSVERVNLNCFVFHRTQADDSVRRGYLQRSFVLCSERGDVLLWPFFIRVVRLMGACFFDGGASADVYLDSVYRNTLLWPQPLPGTCQEFPLLGRVIRMLVAADEFLGGGYDGSMGRVFLEPSVPGCLSPLDGLNVYESLLLLLNDLWTLWELVLCGEHVLVYCQDPSVVSRAVLSIVSLISPPLRYGGEWRPYFTIHDADFQNGKSARYERGEALIGVCNPFFLQQWAHWPHKVLLAADSQAALDGVTRPFSPRKSRDQDLINMKRARDKASGSSAPNVRTAPRSLRVSRNGICVTETQVETTHQSLLGRDKALLKSLVPLKRGGEGKGMMNINAAIARANNRKIRQHFFERTQQFLIPLESYFTSLMPIIPSHLSADANGEGLAEVEQRIKGFDGEQFLARLEAQASHSSLFFAGSKRDHIELYRRFLKSRTFDLWYYERLNRTKAYLRAKMAKHNDEKKSIVAT